jgi:hypothetical protein
MDKTAVSMVTQLPASISGRALKATFQRKE